MRSVTIEASSIKKLIKNIDITLEKGFNASLAFLYVSPQFNIEKLGKRISKYPFHILGATTAGEIYASPTEGVHELEGSLICMLIEVNPKALAMTVVNVEKESYIIGEHVGLWAKSHFKESAIITLTSGLKFDNDAYTQGILSKGINYIFGAAAADDFHLKETFVFSNNFISNQGILALAIDREKINILGTRAFGWGGIGRERIVTKSVKNVVYEIDGMPAINFYKHYLDITADNIPQTGLAYPLEVKRVNGEIIYRAVLAIKEDSGALVFAGHVEEKAQVRISAPRGKSIIQEVQKSTEELFQKYPHFKPQVTLAFPCCSRKQILGHLTHLEIESIAKQTNTPLIGFFAYGEIGAFPGSYGFHNETFVTAFLEERN